MHPHLSSVRRRVPIIRSHELITHDTPSRPTGLVLGLTQQEANCDCYHGALSVLPVHTTYSDFFRHVYSHKDTATYYLFLLFLVVADLFLTWRVCGMDHTLPKTVCVPCCHFFVSSIIYSIIASFSCSEGLMKIKSTQWIVSSRRVHPYSIRPTNSLPWPVSIGLNPATKQEGTKGEGRGREPGHCGQGSACWPFPTSVWARSVFVSQLWSTRRLFVESGSTYTHRTTHIKVFLQTEQPPLERMTFVQNGEETEHREIHPSTRKVM